MKPRKWTADEKLAIGMEGLKEKRSVAKICREHKISQTLYYRWRDKSLSASRQRRASPPAGGGFDSVGEGGFGDGF